MGETAVPKKLYYRIGEACKAVDIQPYVLRYWETEFDALAPGKSKSGQRVYTEQELGVIRRIKELLYEEGYTIAGAKKRLQAELEDGRSFASPELDGELFEEGEGGADDVPVIPVEAGPDAEAGVGSAVETASWSEGEPEAGREPEPAAAAESVAEPRAAVEPAAPEPEPYTDSEAAPRAPASPRRSRSRAKRDVGAGGSVAALADSGTDGSVESASPLIAAAPAVEGAHSVAVDSALSERVETLEHGLRRVLAEVRHLRDLLADSSSGR